MGLPQEMINSWIQLRSTEDALLGGTCICELIISRILGTVHEGHRKENMHISVSVSPYTM